MYKRVATAFFSLMVIFGMLIINLFSVLTENTAVSEIVGTRTETVSTSRGGIYDRNLQPLVNAEKQYICYALPVIKSLNLLKPYVESAEFERLYGEMAKGNIIKTECSHIFSSNEVLSAGVVKRYSRENPCPHLIGYVDGDGNGRTGLEKTYDNYLKMTGGKLTVSWRADAQGCVLLGGNLSKNENNYPDGGGISLTIDRDIQLSLQRIMNLSDIKIGAAVIMDSENSEILASCSIPSFDPENVADYLEKENSPLINRADTAFSVGSVFKPFVAAAAMDNGVSIEHYCDGDLRVDGNVFRCNNGTAHGNLTVSDAMEKSCNTYFIKLGQEVGSEKLIGLCTSLGLGKSFEYEDGVYSKKGNLPSIEDLNSPSALANLSFGQGTLLATPWQMAAAYSAIANGGIYRAPVLMDGILDENREYIQKLVPDGGVRVMSADTAEKLGEILHGVVLNGTAKDSFTERAKAFAKTATAQSGQIKDGREIVHTWLCGYFIYGGKTYTVVIFKEDGTSGGADCAPVFKTVIETVCDIIDSRGDSFLAR